MYKLNISLDAVISSIIFLSILSNIQVFSQNYIFLIKLTLYCVTATSLYFLWNKKFPTNPIILILIIWYLLFFISALLSQNITHGLWIFLNTATLTIYLFFLFFQLSNNKVTLQLERTLISLMIIVIIPSFIVWLIPINNANFLFTESFINNFTPELIKFKGVFLNQNAFAIYLAVYLSIYLYLLTQKKINIFLHITALIAFIFLISTLSRAGIGFLTIFSIIFFISTINSKKSLLIFFITFVFGIIFLLFFDVSLLTSRFSGGLSSRDLIWEDVIDTWLQVPYFGLGPNQYTYTSAKGDHIQLLSTHNEFLSILVNHGFITLVCFGALLIFLIMQTYNLLLKRKISKYMASFSIAFSIALIFHQFFETGGFNPFSISGIMFILILSNIARSHKHIDDITNRGS